VTARSGISVSIKPATARSIRELPCGLNMKGWPSAASWRAMAAASQAAWIRYDSTSPIVMMSPTLFSLSPTQGYCHHPSGRMRGADG